MDGSSTQKLSIISNFSTVLGVSVATFVAGPFLSKFADIEFVASDFIMAILFYFALIWGYGYCVYELLMKAASNVKSKNHIKLIKSGFFLLFSCWLGVVIFPYAKSSFAFVFSNSYLLPMAPKEAIFAINAKVVKEGDLTVINGNIVYEDGAVGTDYRIVVYTKYDGLYSPLRLATWEYSLQSNENGNFRLPISTSSQDPDSYVIVVYRYLDRSFESFISADSGYPKRLTQMDSVEVNSISAFVHSLKT
ncbi:hypothetical protein H8F06_18205 [Vibrio fluvialis]|uniref:hypothetical protein n=1 Tax=Vibrio fluvialis TaxID=676 RepID=UPI001559E015|nr:hypothetical protein [Vibrio fluvialis]EMC0408388.1 hypothetical protein [Vibrio fluvialis]MBL4297229.1 hypothetical protein [Vibrio fluvialis]WDY55246.1 hypothetical protein PUN47_17975 [Vibrio fluvialis]